MALGLSISELAERLKPYIATVVSEALNNYLGGGVVGGSSLSVDDATIELNGDQLRVKAGGIGSSQLADGAVLAEILDDDGPGSGLNADFLDGLDGGDFALSGHGHSHGALSGVAADQHHAQAHAILGADHTGTTEFLTDTHVAAANKDGAAATPSMRTLGTSATSAAAGNDSRLSDSRPPTAAGLAATIHAATSKATPANDDELGAADSAASFGLKKFTWANIKATLKTYFDTLYVAISASFFVDGSGVNFGLPALPTSSNTIDLGSTGFAGLNWRDFFIRGVQKWYAADAVSNYTPVVEGAMVYTANSADASEWIEIGTVTLGAFSLLELKMQIMLGSGSTLSGGTMDAWFRFKQQSAVGSADDDPDYGYKAASDVSQKVYVTRTSANLAASKVYKIWVKNSSNLFNTFWIKYAYRGAAFTVGTYATGGTGSYPTTGVIEVIHPANSLSSIGSAHYTDRFLQRSIATMLPAAQIIYVNSATGSNSNDGLTTTTALATIQAAVDRMPQVISQDLTIYCEGVFTEDITIESTMGGGSLDIRARKNGVDAFFTGTASGGSSTTLTFTSSAFTTGHFDGGKLWIISGTGYGQYVTVTTHTVSGTTNTINVASWPTATPTSASFFTVICGVSNIRSTTTGFILSGTMTAVNIRGFYFEITTVSDTSPYFSIFRGPRVNILSCIIIATRGIQIAESATLSSMNGTCVMTTSDSDSIGLLATTASYAIPRGTLFKSSSAGVGIAISAQSGCFITFTTAAGASGISSFVDFSVAVTQLALSTFNLLSGQNFSGNTVDWGPTNDNSLGVRLSGGLLALNSAPASSNDFRDFIQNRQTSIGAGVIAVGRNDTGVATSDSLGEYGFFTNDTQVTTQKLAAKIDAIASATWATDAASSILRFFTQGVTAGAGLIEGARMNENQTMMIWKGLHLKVVSKTTAYTATINDSLILCSATGAAFTVTLPTAASAYDSTTGSGLILIIKKTDASANAVTVDGSGSETIDGALTVSLATQYATTRIQSNGTSWFVI